MGAQWLEAELLIHCVDPYKLQLLVHGRSRNDHILDIARAIWLITAQLDIRLTPISNDDSTPRDLLVVRPPVFSSYLI